ncbi:hypothetical protein O9H85_05430 [Paenibacillus filicis]|uniref:Uncharacterized protein n=1 Tax=Paenibacillus gyeongsangnamensis TaxID=3388067 RepID=A0ABT4Q4S1_9BACL|nr:hypothetical protein [Paenibacillus filicis]MCZ8511871.1 hypothetical protein [Paenibacillus filicis]
MKRTLLDVQGQVTAVCSRSHISYKFHLGEPGGKLWIRFVYGPKNLDDMELAKSLIYDSIEKYTEPSRIPLVQAKWESYLPLKNLITVSVDDPDNHRGAGHRHDPEQLLFLSAEDASPGLVKGEIPAGMWEVTLSLHAIVTDICNYSLEIWQEEE